MYPEFCLGSVLQGYESLVRRFYVPTITEDTQRGRERKRVCTYIHTHGSNSTHILTKGVWQKTFHVGFKPHQHSNVHQYANRNRDRCE